MVHEISLYKKQDHLGNHNKMRGELRHTRSNTADYRVPGLSIWTVKLQDARRQKNVTKLIEMFEKHRHKEQFLKVTSQKQEINRFSEESPKITRRHESNRDLRTLQEFCNTTMSWVQSLHGNRDHLLQLREKFEVQEESYNNPEGEVPLFFNPGFVIKKNFSSGSKHGQSVRQIMFFKAKEMLEKARQKNMAAIRRYFQGGTNNKDTVGHWRSTIPAKKKSCFTIASLVKDMMKLPHELNGYRTPNIGFFVWMLMGPRNLFDSDKILPRH